MAKLVRQTFNGTDYTYQLRGGKHLAGLLYETLIYSGNNTTGACPERKLNTCPVSFSSRMGILGALSFRSWRHKTGFPPAPSGKKQKTIKPLRGDELGE